MNLETRQGIRQTAVRVFAPPPEVNIWRWAEQYRRLSSDVTAKPGPYSTAEAPYQREPQEAFEDQSCTRVVMLWASRLGKTETMNNLVGSRMHIDPRGIIVVYPTVDSATKWSREFLMPMVRATPVLTPLIKDNRKKDSENTLLTKRFPGGKIMMLGANSPTGFRQVQASVIVMDEVDAFENSKEGDPVVLASKRANNYPNSIEVMSSTPTLKGFSRIEAALDESDYREWWAVPPCCGEAFVFRILEHLKWEPDNPRNAWVECPACGAHLTDAQRLDAMRAGEWRPRHPGRSVRGYWLDQLSTPFAAKKGFESQLHQLAAEQIEARASQAKWQAYVNTVAALTYEESSIVISADPLMKRREEYKANPCPAEVLWVNAAFDVQEDRIEGEKVGWGMDEETWGLGYRIFYGSREDKELWNAIDRWLQEPIEHPSGQTLTVESAFIDSGFAQKQVFAFTRPRLSRQIFACKGSSQPDAPLISKPTKRGFGASRVMFVNVGTVAAKDVIFSRLALDAKAPGFCHYNLDYNQDYFDQLTAEKAVMRMTGGRPCKAYIKLGEDRRNEALDVRVYALANFLMQAPNLRALQTKLAIKDGKTDDKKLEIRGRPLRSRRNFANSWNRF